MSDLFGLVNAYRNPHFPLIALYPALFAEGVESGEERLLLVAHAKLPVTGTKALLVVSNRRVRIYQLGSGMLARAVKSAASFGFDELKGALIGQIPILSEFSDIRDKINEKREQHAAWTGAARAQLEAEQLEEYFAPLQLPEATLLNDEPEWKVLSEASLEALLPALETIEISGTTLRVELDPGSELAAGFEVTTLRLPVDGGQEVFISVALLAASALQAAGMQCSLQHVDWSYLHFLAGRAQPLEDSALDDFVGLDPLGVLQPAPALPPPDPSVFDVPTRSQDATVEAGEDDLVHTLVDAFEARFPPSLQFQKIDKGWFSTKKTQFAPRGHDVFGLDDLDERQLDWFGARLDETSLRGAAFLFGHLYTLDESETDPFAEEADASGFAFTSRGLSTFRFGHAKGYAYEVLDNPSIRSQLALEHEGHRIRALDFYDLVYMPAGVQEQGFLLDEGVDATYFERAFFELLDLATARCDRTAPPDLTALIELGIDDVESRGAIERLSAGAYAESAVAVYRDPASSDAVSLQLVQCDRGAGASAAWIWMFGGRLPSRTLDAAVVRTRRSAWEAYFGAVEAELEPKDAAVATVYRRAVLPLL